MMTRQQQNQGQQSRVLYDLLVLVLDLLQVHPTALSFPDQSPASERRPYPGTTSLRRITPAGFAWLMLGISVSLVLCGWVTFLIGFMLMPWVLGLAMVVGIVSTVSRLGRSILGYAMAPLLPRKDIPFPGN
ncbi:hypothetical protein like AT1G27290 [Hibiscus trionum]|uniref:Transmembrane protein n=1 Tax=Hibiscus trionum TaxID=183268 RepID=A0A9W7LRY6_HIBTR|nr:hypothetical protein like AT1G27290 [Hibiscus trionum]